MRRHLFLPILTLTVLFLLQPKNAFGMHIMEGFLPLKWSIAWGVLSLPFIIYGIYAIQKIVNMSPRLKVLLAMVAAFAFLLSALKIPSVTGSSSHPTGVGLGAILFGPAVMSVLGTIVLLFQAVLLAHGGLSTLGANAFSMAIAGPMVAFSVYSIIRKSRGPQWLAVFMAATLGNLSTYIMTSIQLALAFPAQIGGFGASLTKFLSIFAVTQIPLALSEGLLTILVFNAILMYGKEDLNELQTFSTKVVSK